VTGLLRALAELPGWLIYLVIGTGAAVENFIPPVPADTFVLLGAFIASSGKASPLGVFLVTWVFNVSAAIAVYRLAGKYGQSFFKTRAGHWLLHPKQLEQISKFYFRWGTPAILFSRFLPMFRAAVPVFAGVTHVPASRVILPMAIASAAWYGTLVYVGSAAGKNWDEILAFFDRFSTVLLGMAGVLVIAFLVWWWRSRRHHLSEREPPNVPL
jgi:membrane protein DedA with SNARE-associated domain